MTPSTLTTILNSAPMIIQGASKLIELIKERGVDNTENPEQSQSSIESLQADIEQLQTELAATNKSNIEQIKLIGQLARQNEALAASMAKINNQLLWTRLAAVVAVVLGMLALLRSGTA